MTRLPFALALVTAAGLSAPSAFAGNAGDSLGACYDHVITTCNATSNHPVSCSEAGMDACDDYHSASVQGTGAGILVFRTPGTREGLRFRVPATGRTFPQVDPTPSGESARATKYGS